MFASMDISAGTLIAGFVLGTVGFSVFLYGKKQQRVPQLVAGGLLMGIPVVVTSAVGLSLVGLGIVALLWCVVRAGY